MRLFMIGLVVAGIAGPISLAQASDGRAQCSEAVQSLNEEWRAIAYPQPSKPMQAIVIGHGGHRNSGPEIRFMTTQIRLANIDCAEGRNDEALARVDKVRRLLRTSRDEQGGR